MKRFIIRLIQIIFFFPCVILDGLALFFVIIPIWLFTGKNLTTKEPLIEWLFELDKNEK